MPISLVRRPLIGLVALALLLALSAIGASPAHATGLAVTIACESGLNHFHCDAYPSGGIAPYTYSWQAITNSGITSSTTTATVTGTCSGYAIPPSFTVQVTVRDSTGAMVTKQGGTICRSGAWQ